MILTAVLLAASLASAGVREDVELLRAGTWNERVHAAQQLGESPDGLPGLRLAAEDADWQVRMTAVHLLGRAGPAAVPDLARVLKTEPCRHVRLTALHWLGAIGGPAAEEAIRSGLGDESRMVRLVGRYWLDKADGAAHADDSDAAVAAGEDLKRCESSAAPGRAAWADEPAAKTASRAEEQEIDEPVVTRDPTPKAAPAEPAAAPVHATGTPETLAGTPPLPPRPASPKGKIESEKIGRARLLELDALLSPETRRPGEVMPPGKPGLPERGPSLTKGAEIMADAGTGKAASDPLPALFKLLDDADPAKRARAADELGKRGAVSAEPALARSLKDKDKRVRASAALALGNLGPVSDAAVPALIAALKRGPEEVEWSAAIALGRIGTPRARRAFSRYSRQAAAQTVLGLSTDR